MEEMTKTELLERIADLKNALGICHAAMKRFDDFAEDILKQACAIPWTKSPFQDPTGRVFRAECEIALKALEGKK